MTVSITLDEVRHIARLANLDFTDEEYGQFTPQLNAILEYVTQLEHLETASIEPTSHLSAGSESLREDREERSIPQELALENAPESSRGHFKVPRVIG